MNGKALKIYHYVMLARQLVDGYALFRGGRIAGGVLEIRNYVQQLRARVGL